MTPRRALAALGLALALAGGFLSVGPPRLVLLNTSLRLQYPWFRGGSALLATAGVLLVAGALRNLAMRLLCAVVGVAVLLISLHLFRYRLDATDSGLVSRGVLGSTAIGWKDVKNVEQGADLLVVSGPGEARIRVDTTDFEPEQRASLERTISRRVREATGRVVQPALKTRP